MAKRFLTPINILNSANDPVSAEKGDLYYNTSLDKLKIYANSQWVEVGGGGSSGSTVDISDAEPSSPSSGQLWYNSSSGKTYIYYEDGSSNQWVEVGTASINPTANYDGGEPDTIYGGVSALDGGGVT
jgi:hypothetical protein